MRVLHKALRKNHHLTNGGRIQYGLFLKGIGIPLSAAMTFWKNEFTQVMSEKKFEKEYSYYIKFNYGLLGSRRDYQPFACSKIINSIIGPRDYHGCPFKHMQCHTLEDELAGCGFNALRKYQTTVNLHDRMGFYRLTDSCDQTEISAITSLSQSGQHEAACNKYYEFGHRYFNDNPFKHPNIYFNESVKHRNSHCNYGKIHFLILYYVSSDLQCRTKEINVTSKC